MLFDKVNAGSGFLSYFSQKHAPVHMNWDYVNNYCYYFTS